MGWRVHHWLATPEVLQLSTPGMSADAVNQRLHYTNIFRFAGGDSQKSVAVIGEGKSALSYCCRREIAECSGVGIREKITSKQFWQFGIQCLQVAVSMEISTQRDSEEAVRGIKQSFPLLVSRAMPVVK
ncbi:MAG: hypothetical protein ACYTXI_18675 [Nostoc sp.]